MVVVVSLSWNCSFSVSVGLRRDLFLRRLCLVTVGLSAQFQCRLVRLVQALIFGAPKGLLGPCVVLFEVCMGVLVGFLPCSIGATLCRLRHICWEKCGHGLTSRLGDTASEPSLNDLLGLFGYPARSGRALLCGSLPLRYCAARFACTFPTLRLPVGGHAAALVTEGGEGVGIIPGEPGGVGGSIGRGRLGGRGQRVRPNRKNSSTPCFQGSQGSAFRPRV